MRLHARAAAAGSTSGEGRGPARVAIVLLASLLLGLVVAVSLAQAGKGVVDTFGESGPGDGQFFTAAGAAVNETTNDVYVLDVENNRLQRFDADGGFEDIFGVPGSAGGEFNFNFSSAGIAVDNSGGPSDGSLYVADVGNNRIQKFDAEGNFVLAFGEGVNATTSADLCTAASGDTCQAALSGSGDGELSSPQGVAVDPSNGNVFVADSANNRVQVFDPSGAFLSKFGAPGFNPGDLNFPTRVAVDSTGASYVVDTDQNTFSTRVQKFDSTGAFLPAFNFTDPSPSQVAVDSTNDHVYIAAYPPDFSAQRVVELEADLDPVDTHGVGAGFFANGLALNPAAGRIYVSSESKVFVLDDVTPASAVIDPVTTFTATGATFTGEVNPNGTETSYRFEYSTDQSSWKAVPVPDAPVGDDNVAHEVTETLVGALESNTTYFVRLIATKPFGNPSTTSSEVSFKTAIAKPTITSQGVLAGSGSALLKGRINPQNDATTYRFEYGPTESYGSSAPVPDGSIGSGAAAVAVEETIEGLSPNTTYHFRLVATNSAGTTNGPDRSFTTPGAPPIPPEGRGYEQVSPPDKNGGGILDWNVNVAPSGEGISFASPIAFADAAGAPGKNTYVAARTPSGWETHAIFPAWENPALGFEFAELGVLGVIGMSESLQHSAFSIPEWADSTVPSLDPAAPFGCSPAGVYCPNLYLRNNLGSPDFSLLTTANVSFIPSVAYVGNTGTVLFETAAALTPGDPPFNFKLYEWDNGTIRNVGIDPSGSPFEGFGDEASVSAGITFRLSAGNRRRAIPISEDESRIYFTVGPSSGQIYLREDASATYRVTESEKTAPESSEAASFIGASRDGSRAFFVTRENLVDEDTQAGGEGQDLYMYTHGADPANEDNLTLISKDEEPADGNDAGLLPGVETEANLGGVVGVGGDGTKVYFAAAGQLVDGEPTAPARKLYLWDHNEGDPTLTYIAGLAPADWDNWNEGQRPVSTVVTPDGDRVLVFTREQLVSSEDTDSDRDIYVYDAAADDLACVSCQEPGTPSQGAATLRSLARPPGNALYPAADVSQNITDDGRRIFFETSDELVDRDSNGRIDVYEWEEGEVNLVSSGRSANDSRFIGAGPDGSDVFFLTSERLVGWDVDNSVDVYDARIGGGFPEPPVPPAGCEGDGCASPPAVPNDPTPASSSVAGPGSPNRGARRPRCRRGAKAVKRKGKVRCVRKARNRATKRGRR